MFIKLLIGSFLLSEILFDETNGNFAYKNEIMISLIGQN